MFLYFAEAEQNALHFAFAEMDCRKSSLRLKGLEDF
jgi:hypothetical protein